MLHRRLHRLATTLFMVLSLLLSQSLLAGYVCPAQADAATMAEMMASGQPCDGMDAVQPTLCHEHAVQTTPSFEAVKLPTASLPAAAQVVVLPQVPDAAEAATRPAVAAAQAHAPPDPLFLSTRRLRV